MSRASARQRFFEPPSSTCDVPAEVVAMRAALLNPRGRTNLGSCSRTSAGRGAHMRSAVTPPTGVALALKLHALALVQLLESCTLDAGRVEEQLLAALVPDESEAPISNKARDRAGYRHVCAVPSLSPIGGRPSLPAGRCWRTSVPH